MTQSKHVEKTHFAVSDKGNVLLLLLIWKPPRKNKKRIFVVAFNPVC